MKNMRLSLLLAIGFLLLNSPFAANSQRPSSASPKLEGRWQGFVAFSIPANPVDARVNKTVVDDAFTSKYTYRFEENGTVTIDYVNELMGYRHTGIILERVLIGRKSSDRDGVQVGTYTRTGDKIYIENPDYTVEATIKGNRIEGMATLRGYGKKAVWTTERVLEKSNNSSGAQTTPYVPINPAEGGFADYATDYLWTAEKPYPVEGLVKTESGLRPDKGYRWVNPKDPKDFRVERIP